MNRWYASIVVATGVLISGCDGGAGGGEDARTVSPSGDSPLAGVWKSVSVTYTIAESGERITRPEQPGFLFLQGDHYSAIRVTSAQPRPLFPEGGPSAANAEQLRETWGPFSAHAGTYEVRGDRIIRKRLVSRDPERMVPGSTDSLTFRIAGDSLWLDPLPAEDAPDPIDLVFHLVRVE